MFKKYSRFLALFFALFLAVSPLLTAIPASAAENSAVSLVPDYSFEVEEGKELPSDFYCGPYDQYDLATCTVVMSDGTVVPITDWRTEDGISLGYGLAVESAFEGFELCYVTVVPPDNLTYASGVFCSDYGMATGSSLEIVSVSFSLSSSDVVPPAGDGTSALVAVFGIFSGIGAWLTAVVASLVGIFYADNKLTFVGYLAVAGLAVGVILLLLFLVSGFLRFRG